jgi:putative membrane protein
LTIFFIIFHEVVKRAPRLKRRLISKREFDEEVEEAAVAAFFNQGLYRTREETGVLVFISVFEQKVWVLSDRGIDAKVEEGQWDQIVRIIIAGIKRGRQADSICEAVANIGEILETHFPVKPDDTDELQNLIIE